MNTTQENLITIEKINNKRHLFTKGTNARIPEILMMRLNGVTLEEIGNNFGITRERIRGQEAKGCAMLEEGYMPPVVEPKVPEELTQQKIADNLSARTTNALYYSSIKTIGGLIKKSEYDLLLIDGIGQKALREIKTYLQLVGLQLNKK